MIDLSKEQQKTVFWQCCEYLTNKKGDSFNRMSDSRRARISSLLHFPSRFDFGNMSANWLTPSVREFKLCELRFSCHITNRTPLLLPRVILLLRPVSIFRLICAYPQIVNEFTSVLYAVSEMLSAWPVTLS